MRGESEGLRFILHSSHVHKVRGRVRIYILHKMHGGRRPRREGLGSAGGYRQHTTMSNTNCRPLQNLASIAQNGRAFEDQPSRRRRPQPSRGIATVLSGEQPQWLVGVKGGAKRGAGKEGVCGKHASKAPRASLVLASALDHLARLVGPLELLRSAERALQPRPAPTSRSKSSS